MSLDLLDKTRRINQLLNERESEKIDFTTFCRVLSQDSFSECCVGKPQRQGSWIKREE